MRGYLRIEEVPKAWLFGKSDYRLVQLKSSDAGLLPYEQRLHNSLFEDGASVLLSDLKNEFYTHLSQVKKDLYVQGASANKFFPTRPDNVRNTYLVAGLVVAALGGGAIFLLGLIGAGIIGVPVIIAGLLLALLSPAMPRRTGLGRETMRRSLGFREFMVTAQTDHARFQEEANIFSEYLPYAIVFGCTKKWAEAFEDLELSEEVRSWYSGSGAFYPVVFASSVNSFSESLSTAIASTPSSSGGSGFSGGSSGGGMGGGGGGGW